MLNSRAPTGKQVILNLGHSSNGESAYFFIWSLMFFTCSHEDAFLHPFDRHSERCAGNWLSEKQNDIKSNSKPFSVIHNKMTVESIPSKDCWKLAAVYDIRDKICILGLPATFTPADGGRKDVIHHLFTMGFIYSSVNSCPREGVIEFKCEALGYLLPFKFVFRA